jgi:hypothetical protein
MALEGYGRDDRSYYLRILKGRDLLGNLGLDERIIFKLILKTLCYYVNWIHLV